MEHMHRIMVDFSLMLQSIYFALVRCQWKSLINAWNSAGIIFLYEKGLQHCLCSMTEAMILQNTTGSEIMSRLSRNIKVPNLVTQCKVFLPFLISFIFSVRSGFIITFIHLNSDSFLPLFNFALKPLVYFTDTYYLYRIISG